MRKDYDYVDTEVKTRKQFIKKYTKVDKNVIKTYGRRLYQTVAWLDGQKAKAYSKGHTYFLYQTPNPEEDREAAMNEVREVLETFGREINPDNHSRFDAHIYNLDKVAAELLIYGMYTNHMDPDGREQMRMPGLYFIYGLDTAAIQGGQYDLSKLVAKQKHYDQYIFPRFMCVKMDDYDNDVLLANVIQELQTLCCIKYVFTTLGYDIPDMISREDAEFLREHFLRFLTQAGREYTTLNDRICRDFVKVLDNENKKTKKNDAWRSYQASGRAAGKKGIAQKIDFFKYRFFKKRNIVDMKTILATKGDYTYYLIPVTDWLLFENGMKKFPDAIYAIMPYHINYENDSVTIFFNKKWEDVVNYVATLATFRFDGGMKYTDIEKEGTYRAVVIPNAYMRRFQEFLVNKSAGYAFDINIVNHVTAGRKGDVRILIPYKDFASTDKALYMCHHIQYEKKLYNFGKRPDANMFKKLSFQETGYNFTELEDIDVIPENMKDKEYQINPHRNK